MFQDEQLIEQLGIEALSADEQTKIIEEANRRVGDAVSENWTEQQQNEYQAIIDSDQAVIDAWLEHNVPDYKETDIYKEIAKGFDEDPEHIAPDKVVASIAWIQLNAPNAQEIAAKVVDTYKNELASA